MTKELRRPVLWTVLAVGAAASAYLIRFHIQAELGHPADGLCNLSETVSCAATNASSFGTIGPVPIAVLGMAFYVGMAMLGSRPLRRTDDQPSAALRWMHLLATMGLGYSLFLAGVSAFVLQSLCPVCAVTWATNLVLWIVLSRAQSSWIPRVGGDRPLWVPPQMRPGVVFAAAFASATGLGMFVLSSTTAELPDLEPENPDAAPVAMHALARPGGPAIGPADAPIVFVEFSDFECPFCGRLAESARQLKQHYGDQIRVEFRHFPLSFHPNARPAAIAAECAHEQGKFWEYHDALFANMQSLDETKLREIGEALELDMDAFAACRQGPEAAARVTADIEAGTALGVTGTPAFFIQGVAYVGGWPASRIIPVIDAMNLVD